MKSSGTRHGKMEGRRWVAVGPPDRKPRNKHAKPWLGTLWSSIGKRKKSSTRCNRNKARLGFLRTESSYFVKSSPMSMMPSMMMTESSHEIRKMSSTNLDRRPTKRSESASRTSIKHSRVS